MTQARSLTGCRVRLLLDIETAGGAKFAEGEEVEVAAVQAGGLTLAAGDGRIVKMVPPAWVAAAEPAKELAA